MRLLTPGENSFRKRKRPLNRRGHCKLCKRWKINGFGKLRPDFERFSDHKRRVFAIVEIVEVEK